MAALGGHFSVTNSESRFPSFSHFYLNVRIEVLSIDSLFVWVDDSMEMKMNSDIQEMSWNCDERFNFIFNLYYLAALKWHFQAHIFFQNCILILKTHSYTKN